GQDGRELQARISGICREAGIALCGPNCMGVLNPVARSTTYIYQVRDPSGLAGNVGFISHSGSIANGMLSDVRRFGYSLVVSSGNEAVVGAAGGVEHPVEGPPTPAIPPLLPTPPPPPPPL